jgi:hypothetical protein
MRALRPEPLSGDCCRVWRTWHVGSSLARPRRGSGAKAGPDRRAHGGPPGEGGGSLPLTRAARLFLRLLLLPRGPRIVSVRIIPFHRGLRTRGTLCSGREYLLQCNDKALAIGLESFGPETHRIAVGERPDCLGQAVGARHGSAADQHRNHALALVERRRDLITTKSSAPRWRASNNVAQRGPITPRTPHRRPR